MRLFCVARWRATSGQKSAIFAKLPRCYLLAQDVQARGLQEKLTAFQCISLSELVKLTAVYFPQVAL